MIVLCVEEPYHPIYDNGNTCEVAQQNICCLFVCLFTATRDVPVKITTFFGGGFGLGGNCRMQSEARCLLYMATNAT